MLFGYAYVPKCSHLQQQVLPHQQLLLHQLVQLQLLLLVGWRVPNQDNQQQQPQRQAAAVSAKCSLLLFPLLLTAEGILQLLLLFRTVGWSVHLVGMAAAAAAAWHVQQSSFQAVGALGEQQQLAGSSAGSNCRG